MIGYQQRVLANCVEAAKVWATDVAINQLGEANSRTNWISDAELHRVATAEHPALTKKKLDSERKAGTELTSTSTYLLVAVASEGGGVHIHMVAQILSKGMQTEQRWRQQQPGLGGGGDFWVCLLCEVRMQHVTASRSPARLFAVPGHEVLSKQAPIQRHGIWRHRGRHDRQGRPPKPRQQIIGSTKHCPGVWRRERCPYGAASNNNTEAMVEVCRSLNPLEPR